MSRTLIFSLLASALVSFTPVARVDIGAAQSVSVTLNGKPFANGLRLTTNAGDDVYVPIAALARAVDGEHAARSRLRRDGAKLTAVDAGGCDGCMLSVARPVVVSTRVREIDSVPVFPLTDLVAALEGRLESDATHGTYGIYAGKCTWCILEPR